jgi:outer membrane protein TolC
MLPCPSPQPKSRLPVPSSLVAGLLLVLLVLLVVLVGCSAAVYRTEADLQVYEILQSAAHRVTGDAKTFNIDRPVDTLRRQLLTSKEPVTLSLTQALDVAAENSREFQRQKELLYLSGLALTGRQHEFAVRFASSPSADVTGEGVNKSDDKLFLDFQEDLSASMNTESGGRLVASFFNSWFRDILTGGGWAADSIMSLTFTQPLMRGFGERIAREPLTQAERDVIYSMRSFERFRSGFAIDIVSGYYDVLSAMEDLRSVKGNYASLVRDQRRIQALYDNDRANITDLDRAKQSVLVAQNRVVVNEARLESTLDRFKFSLGLPVDANVNVDSKEFENLKHLQVDENMPDEHVLIKIALKRRFDYQTSLDEVADAGRKVYVAEDALRSSLDFSSSIDVPTDPRQPVDFDFQNVTWAAGFDLDLALDKLVERNAYRAALINLDAAIRDRERTQDQVKTDVRESIRQLRTGFESYRIQLVSVQVASRRVKQTEAFQEANIGNVTTLDVLDAKESLVNAEIALTQARVVYAIARLSLLRDLEALPLEPKGLRYDPGLPLPKEATQATMPEPVEGSR